MTKKDYEKKLISSCESVGTMQPAFKTAISILAEILEQREAVYKAYIADGARPTIIRTLDRGNQNPAKNPLLSTWQDLNEQALIYMNAIGLTAKGLKQIKEKQQTDTRDFFSEYVISLEKELEEAEKAESEDN